METKRTVKACPAELRERAVRVVGERAHEHASERAAIRSGAAKVGGTAETLRQWVRQAERDRGERGGLMSEERARLKALERENRELRQAPQPCTPSTSPNAAPRTRFPVGNSALRGHIWSKVTRGGSHTCPSRRPPW